MLKLLNRIILPAIGITLWIVICIPVCRKAEGIDWFFFWILAGFPFGIRRMFLWLIPRGYGLSGTVGVFAVNIVLGGLIGGVILLGRMARILIDCGRVVTGNFWT